jgi:hypothetical protein
VNLNATAVAGDLQMHAPSPPFPCGVKG